MIRIIDDFPYLVDREFIVSLDILIDDGARSDNETAYINAHSAGLLEGKKGTWVVFMRGYYAGQSRGREDLREMANRLYGENNYLLQRVNGIELDALKGPRIL